MESKILKIDFSNSKSNKLLGLYIVVYDWRWYISLAKRVNVVQSVEKMSSPLINAIHRYKLTVASRSLNIAIHIIILKKIKLGSIIICILKKESLYLFTSQYSRIKQKYLMPSNLSSK